jgi:hypothetical protein
MRGLNGYYRTKKVVVDGIVFGSGAESKDYQTLKLLEKAGKVRDLTLQPLFVLQEGFTNAAGRKIRPITYRADFSFFDCDQNRLRVLDTKGWRTDKYKLKKKMFDYLMRQEGISLEETI